MTTTTISAEMNSLDSYPPPFRPQNNQTHNPDPDKSSSDPTEIPDPVPVIDLHGLNQSLDEQKKLEEACKDWGLFRLVNHGIPLTLLSQLQDLVKELFSTSFESKQASTTNSPISYFWGTAALTPKGTAVARGPQSINWLEGFNIPLSQLSQFEHQVPKLDSFRVLVEEYGNHLSRIARTLYETMAKNLDLDPESSKSCLSEETGIVRVYRYPVNSNADDAMGMEVHTDSSVLSILHQNDGVNGLEVLRDDQWHSVKPFPNSLIVNLGDMMQAISDDKFKSVKHRVKVNKERERISICYFVFPDEDVLIQSSTYKPFNYNDFRAQVQKDVKTVGYKVGLERFKINEDC